MTKRECDLFNFTLKTGEPICTTKKYAENYDQHLAVERIKKTDPNDFDGNHGEVEILAVQEPCKSLLILSVCVPMSFQFLRLRATGIPYF